MLWLESYSPRTAMLNVTFRVSPSLPYYQLISDKSKVERQAHTDDLVKKTLGPLYDHSHLLQSIQLTTILQWLSLLNHLPLQ